jgi:S-layer protein
MATPTTASLNTVTQDYSNILFRSASLATELTPWANALDGYNAGTNTIWSPSAIANAIALSAEAQNDVLPIVRLYQAAFNRAPDIAGLQSWVNGLRNGLSFSTIVQGFVSSAEFAATYGSANPAASTLLPMLYANVLGRAPDAVGFAAWANAMNNGMSIASVVTGFVNATEFVNNSSSVIDSWLTTYAASNTYVNSIAIGDHAAPVTTTTFTLTTAIDTIVATAAYSAFNGTFGTANSNAGDTLNPLDSITATGLGNVLNITDQGLGASAGVVPTITVSGVQTANIQSVVGETVNTTSWTGLTNLNITASSGADTVTAAGTTAINVTDTAGATTTATTINGGSSVNLTLTANDGGAAKLLGSIAIGGTTAPTGAVTVTATETYSNAASAPGDITVTGGTNVTVNSTVNAALAIAAAAGAGAPTGVVTAGDASLITVTGATGNVVVNDAINVTSLATVAVNADAVSVTGGSTITVNETATAIQTATGVSTVTEGVVTITGSAATTAVTVNQAAVATGNLVVAAAPAVTQVRGVTGETAQPGITGVTAVTVVGAVAAITAKPTGVPTITADAAVTITDKAHATATTASNTITSVTLGNYGAGSLITDNALSNLSLSGTGGTLTITNAATGTALTNTTLNLSVNNLSAPAGNGGSNAITDTNTEITTLNVTTGASNSTLTSFGDASLTTLNVSGSSVLTLGTVPASITTLTVTGGAGFNGDISGTGVTAFAPTSTGKITTTLSSSQSFTGGAGQDIVKIGAFDATKNITGGSATNNEIILTGVATTYTHAKTGTHVTGFTTLGADNTTGATVNVYDMKNVFTGYNALDVVAQGTGASSTAFVNVASGSTLAIDASLAGTGTVAAVEGNVANTSVLYQVVDATGASDTLALTMASGITVAQLMLEDANAVGIGTLNITGAGAEVITTLVDNGLSNLTIGGSTSFSIGTLNEATTQATAFTLTNNEAAFKTVTIGAFTDNNLGSLNFVGTGDSSITTLNDTGHVLSILSNGTGGALASIGTLNGGTGPVTLNFGGSSTMGVDVGVLNTTAASLTLANVGSSSATVGDGAAAGIVDASLTSLTLSGNVAVGLDTVTGTTPNAATATGATTGVTITGGTDNAHVNFNLTGAAANKTDSITLGNGNDYITDGSTAGTVTITVGTGSNLIVLANASATTYSAAITLGAHTSAGPDSIVVGSVFGGAGAGTGAVAPNVVITGAVTGDILTFADAATSVVTLSAANQSTVTSEASLAAAVGFVDALAGTVAHSATVFTYSGNTFVLESVGAGTGTLAVTDGLVELVGVHTLSSTVTSGHLTLA